MGFRFRAFCHCLDRFSPLGFQATREYLASLVGADDRWTEQQLMEALDLLMQERRRWLDFDAMWNDRRRSLKASGERAVGVHEEAERQSMPWLSWPRDLIRNRRRVLPTIAPTEAFAFRPDHLADYEVVTTAMPRSNHDLPLSFDVKIYDDWLRIPHRIYNPEPTPEALGRLSQRQALMLNCLYTRHHDGYVRHRHLKPLLRADEPWVAPYVVALVGEYVVEIVQDIADGLMLDAGPRTWQRIIFGRFARENTAYMTLIHQRVWSYWRAYYASGYRGPTADRSERPEYPGFVVLRALQAAAAER
jgi:hypothetical protein